MKTPEIVCALLVLRGFMTDRSMVVRTRLTECLYLLIFENYSISNSIGIGHYSDRIPSMLIKIPIGQELANETGKVGILEV
jgi:hypothetical protein